MFGPNRDSIPQPLFYILSINLTLADSFIAVDVGVVGLTAVGDAERVLSWVARRIRLVPQKIEAILAEFAHEKGALVAALRASINGVLTFYRSINS